LQAQLQPELKAELVELPNLQDLARSPEAEPNSP
jgi:hypothetical protein